MGILTDFLKIKKEKVDALTFLSKESISLKEFLKIVNDETIKKERFSNIDIKKTEFFPIDGEELRMRLYGCYKGDRYICNGKEVQITEDEVEQLIFIPKEIMQSSEQKRSDLETNILYAKMYLGEFQKGDCIEVGDYVYTYVKARRNTLVTEREYFASAIDKNKFNIIYEGKEREYYKILLTDAEARKVNGEEIKFQTEGWQVKCKEKEKPLIDVVMRDELLGKPIVGMEKCFYKNKNLVNIKHLPKNLVFAVECFAKSGIQNFDKELLKNQVFERSFDDAYLNCYNLVNTAEELIRLSSKRPIQFKPYGLEQSTLDSHKDLIVRKSNLEDFLQNNNSIFTKFETVSFVYKYNPIKIERALMDGEWYAIEDGLLIPYEEYMKQHFSKKEDISGLSVDSFCNKNEKQIAKKLLKNTEILIEEENKSIEELKEIINANIKKEKSICNKIQNISKEIEYHTNNI